MIFLVLFVLFHDTQGESSTIPPIHCPTNFVFRQCATCNATCANRNPICTEECKPPSCNCLTPYALDPDGSCVLADSCPIQCEDKNEEFLALGLLFPRGCGVPNPSPITNTTEARPGCYCKRGFVRNNAKKCVPRNLCFIDFCSAGCLGYFDGCNGCSCPRPSLCTLRACSPQQFGFPSCSGCIDENRRFFEENPPIVRSCNGSTFQPTGPGCYCADPMRLQNETCVRQSDCPGATTQPPPRCPPNFVFRTCQTCNATCTNPNPICTKICRPPGCNCVSPNALDARGNCIKRTSCPLRCRDRNAEYLAFGLVARRSCAQPYPRPITRGMIKRPGCYCKRGFVMRFGRCIPLRQCNTCTRSSYLQQTKDLTRYLSCIPASIDVGTCRGSCLQHPHSRICTICDVATFVTQRIRCRNLVGAQVFVNIDVVKSCGCGNVVSFPTGIVTRRPTRRPTTSTCPPNPPIRRVCLRYVGSVTVPDGFLCGRDSDARIDARLNRACRNQFGLGVAAISGGDIRAENLNPGSIECLPPSAPRILVPRCPYCNGCDCNGRRVCALGNSTARAWSNVANWSPNHVDAVLRAGCVKRCTGSMICPRV